MGDVPTINTGSWRLPKKAHSAPEATFTDDMYRAKGLPVDPERAPATGGSGLPTVDTSDWRLPSTQAAAISEGQQPSKKRHHAKPFEIDLDDDQFKDLGDDYDDADFDGLDDKTGRPMPKKRAAKAAVESSCSGKRSFLKRKKRQESGPPRAVDNDAVGEDVQSVQRRLAGLTESSHLEFATGQPYRRMPDESRAVELTERAPAPKRGPSRLPKDQQALAGLTERAPLPHPMHDTRPVGAGRAHGILDDGMDGGEAFVDQILQESRWFFEEFGGPGGKRPFDEAPGGRAGPWRGSDDEPAQTPVVRHGKVKGMVGDEPEDDEGEEGKDQKQVPPKAKAKGKPKAPPEEEPEEDDEEEPEEQDESVLDEAGLLKKFGARVRGAGERIKGGKRTTAAREKLHGHLKKFAKKHGIKAFGHDPEEAAKKGAKKSKVAAKAKPKVKPKPLAKKGAKKSKSRHALAMKKSLAKKAKLTKSGKAPKLKKMKRRLREIVDSGPPNILL